MRTGYSGMGDEAEIELQLDRGSISHIRQRLTLGVCTTGARDLLASQTLVRVKCMHCSVGISHIGKTPTVTVVDIK